MQIHPLVKHIKRMIERYEALRTPAKEEYYRCPLCGQDRPFDCCEANDVRLVGSYGSSYDGDYIDIDHVCAECFDKIMAWVLEEFPLAKDAVERYLP